MGNDVIKNRKISNLPRAGDFAGHKPRLYLRGLSVTSHNYVYLYLICFDECFVLAHLDFFSLILLMNDMLIHCTIFVHSIQKKNFLKMSIPLCIIDCKNDGRSSGLHVSCKINSVGKQCDKRGHSDKKYVKEERFQLC